MNHGHHGFQSCHCRSHYHHLCHCALAHAGCYTCPLSVHPMRCHRSPPTSVSPCPNVPMKYNSCLTIDHSKKRKIDSILLKPATYHISVRPLSSIKDDRTIDQLSETKIVRKNQNFPSVPCRKIISERNQIHVSSTSFLFTMDDQVTIRERSCGVEKRFIQKNLLVDAVVSKRSPRENSICSTSSTKPLINAQHSNDNIALLMNSKKKTRYQNTKAEDAVSAHHHSANKKAEDTIEDIERKDDVVIEISSNEVSIQSDLVQTISNPSLTKDDESINQISESVLPPSSSPPDINRIKSNEIVPRRIRSLISVIRERPKSITDIRKSNGSLGKTRSTIDFGFLIDEVVASVDEKKRFSQ